MSNIFSISVLDISTFAAYTRNLLQYSKYYSFFAVRIPEKNFNLIISVFFLIKIIPTIFYFRLNCCLPVFSSLLYSITISVRLYSNLMIIFYGFSIITIIICAHSLVYIETEFWEKCYDVTNLGCEIIMCLILKFLSYRFFVLLSSKRIFFIIYNMKLFD